jgi:rhomboid protease GluP
MDDQQLRDRRKKILFCPSCNGELPTKPPVCPYCGRVNPNLFGYGLKLQRFGPDYGLQSIIILGCIAIYFVSIFLDLGGNDTLDPFTIIAPSNKGLFLLGSTGAIPVFGLDRWWTIFTAPWLHGSFLHLASNLYGVKLFLPGLVKKFKAAKAGIIYLSSGALGAAITSVAGHYIEEPSFLQGSKLSVGASGAVFGLLGAWVAYGQLKRDHQILQKYSFYSFALFAGGLIMPRVDNWGHLGGWIAGYALGHLHWLTPFSLEKNEHFLLLLSLLGITAVSLILSLGHGYYILGHDS